jgi:hypothetical protein
VGDHLSEAIRLKLADALDSFDLGFNARIDRQQNFELASCQFTEEIRM